MDRLDLTRLEVIVGESILPPSRPPRPRPSTYECPNCLQRFPVTFLGRAYCSTRCHDEAKLVRYARRKRIEYGGHLPADIHDAIGMKIAHALAGGYPEQARRLTPERRGAVFKRDESRCVLCGGVGEEIDHIAGSSNELDNLRLLCDACHNQVTRSRFRPIDGDPAKEARHRELVLRIAAREPLRPCDAADWHTIWRTWVREHAQFSDHDRSPA